MPFEKKQFSLVVQDLQQATDVDDSAGRSVPINMNYIDEGFLTKDTGFSLYGNSESTLCHSPFHFKKKDGTSYKIRARGTRLQKHDGSEWVDISTGTFTVTIATPGVFTLNNHGLVAGSKVQFATTGALPTGLTTDTTYYVIATDLSTNSFKVSETEGGSAVDTTGSQSGVHTLYREYTASAEFGWAVYDDLLYGGNAAEYTFTWDGSLFTDYTDMPKGNVLEVFEDRMFVTGVTLHPGTYYYSGIATGTAFSADDVINPLGTDHAKTMKNYYGTLMLFKAESIWKLTFIYDQVAGAFVPKIEQQSNNYGACSRKAVSWVENDLWFFTGRELRAIGFQDNQTGVFGINRSVISEPIKETLKRISVSNFSKVSTFYKNRRFYLSIPLEESTNDTIFVCHLLYKNAWTKYFDRIKATSSGFMAIDDDIYSTTASFPYGTIKWDTSLNEVAVQTIVKEPFDTDPEPRGWVVGSDWEYDATNDRMKIA